MFKLYRSSSRSCPIVGFLHVISSMTFLVGILDEYQRVSMSMCSGLGTIHFGPQAGPTSACKKCGFSRNTGLGVVVETCLECFLDGGSLCRYNYNTTLETTCPTCTTVKRRESESQIVETAKEKLKKGFGEYNLLSNNCEHFATFCSSGKAFCQQIIHTHTGELAADPLLPPYPSLDVTC
ncbi:phospholipase A and acyltransferase 4-like [Populus alba x Populus x berolinensis]|nr:phospholipase A and acyltransferase 4-like [Populus alba x Populus x berolinensis]